MSYINLEIEGKKLKDPIFIVGCGRSGTQLLLEILSKNENIYCIPKETHFFRDLKPKIYTLCNTFEKNKNFEILTLSVLTIFEKGIWDIYDEVRAGSFSESVIQSFKGIKSLKEFQALGNIQDVFNVCACYLTAKNNKNRWLEKTPGHVRTYFRILREYSKAKIILIIRDPRATYCSWKNSLFFKDSAVRNIIVFLIIWKLTVKIAKYLLNSYSAQFYLLKYENLINHPEKEITNLCNFLSERFNNSMLDIEVTNSSFLKCKKGFSKEVIFIWKEKLSKCEILFLDFFTKKERKWLNYANSNVAFNLTDLFLFPIFIAREVLNLIFITINKLRLKSKFYLDQLLYEAGSVFRRK